MLDPTRGLPPKLVQQAREYADGTRTPAEPRNAATVVLARNGSGAGQGSLELYFLRRHVEMAFAAGMAVFPGGGVDERDFAAPEVARWAGPSPQDWAARLGADLATAAALVLAAVRETFEESGVLLAGPTAETVVADTTGADWEADRQALVDKALSFSAFLVKRDLVVRTDLLAPWALWVTPVFEPRRYRTWFFLAALPEGQRTRDVSTESDQVMWLPVRTALELSHASELLMLPPQYCTCLELFDAGSIESAIVAARERELDLVQPTARFQGDQAHLEIPERLVSLGESVRAQMGAA